MEEEDTSNETSMKIKAAATSFNSHQDFTTMEKILRK